jgi:hypothetical protein
MNTPFLKNLPHCTMNGCVGKNARSGTVGHGDMFFVLCGCLE